MANPGDFAYTVKQQADIVRIVGEYVKLRKSGAQNFTGLCPFHNEKTGSFSVHATRQFYHCFGCGESGDVFKFVQKIENVTFPEAVRIVAQKLGIALPKMQFSSPEEAREASLRGRLLDIQERACAWFQEQLRKPEAAHAREYLKNRGLNDDTIAQFRIGFAPESGFLLRDRLKGEFDEEIMRASGLFSWKEEQQGKSAPAAMYSKFRNRVVFPICNESGRVIAFTGRTLVADEKAGPKYLNSPETPIYSKSHVLFNLHLAKEAIRRLDYVILVEGQMDCISVFAAGMHNVIATSGTAFTEPQVRLLARHTRNIVVNFDPDAAGAAAADRSLTMLLQEDFNIKVVTLEAGYDPDLYVRKRGVPAYTAALKAAPRYFDYLIDRARTQFPIRTAEGKIKALNFLLPYIQRVPNRIARDEIANEVAQKLNIDSAVLRQELRHVASARTATKVTAPPQAQVTEAERILIRALAGNNLSGEIEASSREGEEHAFDPARQVRFVLEAERLHSGLSTEALIDALLKGDADPMLVPIEEADRRLVAEILMHEDEELTPELLEQAIAALRRIAVEQRQRELNARIREAEQKQDTQALAQLLRDKRDLDRTLVTKRPV
jgi:DNA primase